MRNPIIALASRRSRGQHPGLLLQRYLARPATGDTGDPEERRALLEAARAAASDSQVQMLYKHAYDRWVSAMPATEFAELTTAGRMVIGLGCENVLETGLRLHHTYGLPVIPGSALKGLANHYCDQVWGQRQLDAAPEENLHYRREGKYHSLLFGTTDDGGAITFHDAWITPASVPGCLCLDVMTPHHPKWQNNEAAPTDFDSPVPVSFLSVAGTFRVGVSWSGPPEHEQAKNWTTLAFELLKDALKDWGVGGKTTSGYGRLVVPNATQPTKVIPVRTPVTLAIKPNAKVTAKIVADPKGKGRPFAEYQGLVGNILNVPPGTELSIGADVTVVINSVNEAAKQIAFKWPT